MAIKKQVTAANGIVTEYHRIAMVSIDTNNQCTVLVHSYLSEGARQFEKDYSAGLYSDADPAEITFPYVESNYINFAYDGDMTVEKAYGALKEMENFKDSEDLFDEWSGESIPYKKGDYVTYNGKVYKVLQSHSSQTDWTPDAAVSLFVLRPEHKTDYDEFVQPTGAHDVYSTGDKVTYKGQKYMSIIDNNAWSPDAYPAGWKLVEESSGDGTTSDGYPEFVQPTGAHDAYSAGDKVLYKGSVYRSLINANTWSPDAYPAGWELVEE